MRGIVRATAKISVCAALLALVRCGGQEFTGDDDGAAAGGGGQAGTQGEGGSAAGHASGGTSHGANGGSHAGRAGEGGGGRAGSTSTGGAAGNGAQGGASAGSGGQATAAGGGDQGAGGAVGGSSSGAAGVGGGAGGPAGSAGAGGAPPVCGNGVMEVGELCDDHNVTDGDGCDSNCTPTACGNGIHSPGEVCLGDLEAITLASPAKTLAVGDVVHTMAADVVIGVEQTVQIYPGGPTLGTPNSVVVFEPILRVAVGPFSAGEKNDVVILRGTSRDLCWTKAAPTGPILDPTCVPMAPGFSSEPASFAIGPLIAGDVDVVVAETSGIVDTLPASKGGKPLLVSSTAAAGVVPIALTLGSFTNDTALDAVVASTSVLELFAGDGSGGLKVAGSMAVPETITAITTLPADDGDSVAATLANGTVLLLRLGAFGQPIKVGGDPRAIIAADIDRDGTPDLITADHGSNTASILLGPVGMAPTVVSVLLPGAPYAVASGDVDGDGLADLVFLTESSAAGIVVLHGQAF